MHSTQNDQPADQPEEKVVSPEVKLFFKVGGYFGWTWREFEETPWHVIKQLSWLLDEKESDMGQFVSYFESALFKCLKRLFPSNDK